MELVSSLGWFMVEGNLVIVAPLPKLNDAEFDALDALLGEEWGETTRNGKLGVKVNA